MVAALLVNCYARAAAQARPRRGNIAPPHNNNRDTLVPRSTQSDGVPPVMEQRYIELIVYRALADFRSEVSRMYLGILWWFLEPIMYVMVFYVVFGIGFLKGSHHYVPFLLCGLIVWKWLDSTVRTASGTVAQSVGIMSQVYLPKIVFPLITVVTNFLKFLIILVIFLLFLWIYGEHAHLSWLWLLVLIPLQLLLVAALASLAAGLVPLVPDLRHAINYGMTFLFFASGIFFDPAELSARARHILDINPVIQLIEMYRAVLLKGVAPSMTSLAYLTVLAVVLLGASSVLFRKMDRVYPRLVG
jgi:lipopolysaccharide transport system permease protein